METIRLVPNLVFYGRPSLLELVYFRPAFVGTRKALVDDAETKVWSEEQSGENDMAGEKKKHRGYQGAIRLPQPCTGLSLT